MFEFFADLTTRPARFAGVDTAALWTDPHVAERMLALHLDDSHAVASRPTADIAAMVAWIDAAVGLAGKRLTDLGCGPGLYCRMFQACGARVTGLDFSDVAIAHARQNALAGTTFTIADYLRDPMPEADVITLIYGDICALSPALRARLLHRIAGALAPGGVLILDAFPEAAFDARQEGVAVARRMDEGFWAPGDYVGIKASFLYPETTTALDRFVIVESERCREVFAWLEYFSPERLAAELAAAGFSCEAPRDAVTGGSWEKGERPFALVARR